MMVVLIRTLVSGCLGVLLWLALHVFCSSSLRLVVPIVVQGVHAHRVLAPNALEIMVSGAWRILRTVSNSNPKVIIESVHLSSGMQEITLTPQHLLLPPSIKLVNYASIPLFVSSS